MCLPQNFPPRAGNFVFGRFVIHAFRISCSSEFGTLSLRLQKKSQMKKFLLPVAVFGLLLSISSCGGKDNKVARVEDHYYDSIRKADSLAENGPPLDLNFTQAKDKANDDKRVAIIGYLALPHNSYTTGSSGQLQFIERPNDISGLNFILSVPIGSGNNAMKALPDKYTNDDVKVKGKNGEKITIGDRVKITGKLRSNETYCSLNVQEIEKLEAVELDYSTLNATKITTKPDASFEDKLVVIEGTLEMPMLSMGGESTFLYLHVPGIEEQLTVDFAYGTGPAKLEPLPENYGDKDIKIQDTKGNYINLKKKVRVYGVWHSDRLKVEAVDNI
jgi:hypothetical protein